jgi:hypothetical protein
MKMSKEHWCYDPDRGKYNYSESLASATQIAHSLAWNRTRVSEDSGWRLTALDVTRLLRPEVLLS